MNWFSVEEKDKLSESMDDVLFTNGKELYRGYRFASFENTVEGWYCDHGYSIDNVTHWMPLPELPND